MHLHSMPPALSPLGQWLLEKLLWLRAAGLVQHPVLQMEKLRPTEGKGLVPCCTANREQSENRDPDSRRLNQAP